MADDAIKVLFLQGAGEGTHDDCDSKLVDSLTRALGPAYTVSFPRMPEEGNPQFALWATAIIHEIDTLRPSMIVGHSFGGTVLIHTLAQHGRLLNNITGICLIAAPFLGDEGWSWEGFTLVEGWAKPLATFPVHLFQGDADVIVAANHAELYAAAIPNAHLHTLPGHDHMLNNDMSEVARVLLSLSI